MVIATVTFHATPLLAQAEDKGAKKTDKGSVQEIGSVKIEGRSFKTKSGQIVEYELGTLFAPENRSIPDSRVIGVGFARFRVATKDATAPPVFRLPGGPGGSLLSRMKTESQLQQAYGLIAEYNRFSDVVVVDQRGYSERGDVLTAPFRRPSPPADQPLTSELRAKAFKAFAEDTVAQFKKKEIDLAGYTVKECAHDVADIAKALGYKKITLEGTSYGSQWSFAIMRLHPNIVARALLSGIEPLNSGYDMPSYVFAAIQRMWRVVDADPKFKPYLPKRGMAEAARIVIERLEREPIALEIQVSDEEKPRRVGTLGPDSFPWFSPTQILELYHNELGRWQREAMARAIEAPRRVRLIGPLIDSSLSTTPERKHRLWTDPATRYLSRRNFASYMATADIWPSPDVGDEFRTPVLCDIPVVFTQGTWDFKTPVENTFEIAPFFTNSRIVIGERGGHGILGSIRDQHPDAWSELIEFLETGGLEDIPVRVRLKASQQFEPPSFEVRR